MAIPNGNTAAGIRRQALRLARDGGVSTFALETNRKLACAVTDMLAVGDLVRTESHYPWVGLALPKGE